MVLPSNGCPDTHPENEANNYVISWEQPIQLNATKWKVALTEANFSYTMSSMSTMFGIRVERKWLTNLGFRIKLTGDIEQRKLSLTFPDIVKGREKGWFSSYNEWKNVDFRPPIAYYYRDNVLIEATSPFTVEALEKQWTATELHDDKYRVLIPGNDLTRFTNDEGFVFGAGMKYVNIRSTSASAVFAQEEVFWSNTAEILDGLMKQFYGTFERVEMLNGKLKFTIRGGVTTIEFLNGFNICLGFSKRKYRIVDSVLFAESEPYLRHGINSMYVYSSIVQPIRVGNVCVPLLKSVWLDRGGGKNTSHSFGEVCNITVKNPMYLPVSSTSINSIEVNIRSDSGRLIPFVEGSITSLTLHFKRK